MAASGKTFFQAARLLPRDVRDSVIHLYAFCRYIDDLADESTESVANRSKQLEQLQQILVSNENGKPIYEGAALVSSLNLSPASRWAASVLVGAAREDLRQKQPETEADLISYAFGVAGTVGLMMAEVLGARKEGTRAAVELGIAMQLSNIARDVAQDLRAGRIYLPTCWLTSRDIELALDQQAEQSQKLLVGSTLRLLTLADAFYDSAFSGIWTLPWRMRWSILAAALCYREIGIQVGKDIKASWQSRTIVPRWRKLTLIATAGLRLLLPRYWKVQARGRYSRQTKLPEQLPLESTLAEALSG
jgi:phytoene synthase